MLSKGDLRDGLRRLAEAGLWESPKELFVHVAADPRLKSVNFWDFLRQYRKDETKLEELRDAATATRGSDRRGYVPPELDCPGRHWAVAYTTWDDGFFCNLCEAVVSPGVICLGCRLCDYDVCPTCVDRLRVTTKGTGATRTLTSLGTNSHVQQEGKKDAAAQSSDVRPRRRKKKVASNSSEAVPIATQATFPHEELSAPPVSSSNTAVEKDRGDEVSVVISSQLGLSQELEHVANLGVGAKTSSMISAAPCDMLAIDPVNVPVPGGDSSSDDDL